MNWRTFLHQRDRQPEVMDQSGLDPFDHSNALIGLRRINKLSGCSSGLFDLIRRIATEGSNSPLRILEIACGSGDTAIDLSKMAKREGFIFDIHACDISNQAISIARINAINNCVDINFYVADALSINNSDQIYDVIYCTLFTHHLDSCDVVKLLTIMALRSRNLVIIDDLIRSRYGYILAWLGTRLLSRSWVVHTDGPLSVRSAFKLKEFRDLVEEAGLHGCVLRRYWPERFVMSWSRKDHA